MAFAIAALIFSVFSGPRQTPDVDITQVASDIKNNKIQSIAVQGDNLTIEYNDPSLEPRILLLPAFLFHANEGRARRPENLRTLAPSLDGSA